MSIEDGYDAWVRSLMGSRSAGGKEAANAAADALAEMQARLDALAAGSKRSRAAADTVDAVNRGGEKPYVLVAKEGALDESGNVADPSLLERREVTLGRNDTSYIEITGGLS